MAVCEARVLPGFLTPVLTQISFQSHRLLFSDASAEVRGEISPQPGLELTTTMSPTRPPLSHPRGAHKSCTLPTVLQGSAEVDRDPYQKIFLLLLKEKESKYIRIFLHIFSLADRKAIPSGRDVKEL